MLRETSSNLTNLHVFLDDLNKADEGQVREKAVHGCEDLTTAEKAVFFYGSTAVCTDAFGQRAAADVLDGLRVSASCDTPFLSIVDDLMKSRASGWQRPVGALDGSSPRQLSSVSLPVRGANERRGLLLLFKTGRDFSAEEVLFAAVLAEHVGAALRRAEYCGPELTRIENVRQRMCDEIHDGFAQSVYHIILEADILARVSDPSPEQKRRIDRIRRLARGAMRDARSLINDEQDEDSSGIGALLAKCVGEFSDMFSADVSLVVHGDEMFLDAVTAGNLLGVAREALNNVVKHSMATRADVELEYGSDYVLLRVTDDGIGFAFRCEDRNREAGGFGLKIMGRRASDMAGSLDISRMGHGGTRVEVKIPWRRRPSKAV